nr:PREDICTED: nuclear receptor coactivator 7-like [Paralichthys olivaceus]
MEKRDRKPGYFARLKRRRQLKQSQSDKNVNEQSPAIITCPDVPHIGDPNKKTDLQRIATKPAAASDDGCKSNNQTKREKRGPPGTVEFIVGPNDSLNSIALKFNITPNKLVQLNKLFSRSVYPGQKLFVPDESQSETDLKSPSSSHPTFSQGLSEKPSHDAISNFRSARSIRRELSPNSEDESPSTVKFIKMSCKYFTDGMGVVGGVLIVTPNNIMFDPHKSDPLVIEHGCEEYGLICPMEEVVSVALYNDVSRMKLKDALPSPGEWEQLLSERELNPFSRYEALDPKRPIILDEIESAISETVSAVEEETEKSPSDEGFTELEQTVNGSTEEAEGTSSRTSGIVSGDHQKLLGPGCPGRGDTENKSMLAQTKGKPDDEEDEGVAQNGSIEDGESIQSSSETEKQGDLLDKPSNQEATKTKDMKPKGTEELLNNEDDKILSTSVDQSSRLSLTEAAEVCRSSGPERPAEGAELSEEERRKKSYEAEVKSWLMERMQAPIEDMLFSSEEKSKNPPMFLCFKVGKPMRKSFATGTTSCPAHSFGSRGKQPEYWFAVPQERCDYALTLRLFSQIFGAFSTHPFRVSEHCYGTGETFLYNFCPEIKVYRWTGENSYFVKGNIDSLQMGGGGGQLGLWLDAELYRGASTKCATFNNQPLSAQQDFSIHSLEVWTFE